MNNPSIKPVPGRVRHENTPARIRNENASVSRLLVLSGMSDSGFESVELGDDGALRIMFKGGSGLLPALAPGKFRTRQIWLGGKRPDSLVPRLRARPLVNDIADVDNLSRALGQAIRVVEQAGNPPCFNPPQLVARTRRDLVASNLADVPEIRVPRTVRLEPRTPEDFAAAARANNLAFPLIVRLAGDHHGNNMVRIDKRDQWDVIHTLPWQGRAVYLTELVDCRDPDGLYRTHRIIMVGGKPCLAHISISDQWKSHRSTHLAEHDAEEKQRLAAFDSKIMPYAKPVLDAIHRRIRLDCYGLDLHIGEDGKMTLFKISAVINEPGDSKYPQRYRDAYRLRIQKAIVSRLERYIRPGQK